MFAACDWDQKGNVGDVANYRANVLPPISNPITTLKSTPATTTAARIATTTTTTTKPTTTTTQQVCYKFGIELTKIKIYILRLTVLSLSTPTHVFMN